MKRFRYWFLIGGSAFVAGLLFATDPDKGQSTSLLLLAIATGIIAVLFAHFARKALHDYPEADARRLFGKAGEHPIGAGLALVALAIVLYGLLGLFGRVHAQIPAQAHQHLPTLKAEVARNWPEHIHPPYFGGLIEHESCLSLTHPRCWNPKSRLKSDREEGAGLGQITRAFNPDGTTRFDSLADMRERHPALQEWTWLNVYQRPDLQIRGVVLMSKDNWAGLRMITDPWQRLALADAAYNGGLGGVQRDRRACGMTPPCDPQVWWGNVERHCTKSRRPLYGGRSACDINRHHVKDVWTRMAKYEGLV